MLAQDRALRTTAGKAADRRGRTQELPGPVSANSDRSSKHQLDLTPFCKPLCRRENGSEFKAKGTGASRPRRRAVRQAKTSTLDNDQPLAQRSEAAPAACRASSAEGSSVLSGQAEEEHTDAEATSISGGPAASSGTDSWQSDTPSLSPAEARAEAEQARSRARSKAREAWQLILEAQTASQDSQLQAAAVPARASARTSNKPVAQKDALVDARVSVFWPQDRAFYRGRVVDYNAAEGCHKVHYDDDAEEWLVLAHERFTWLSPRGCSAGCSPEMQEGMAKNGATGVTPPSSGPPASQIHASSRSGGPRLDADAVAWKLMVHFPGCLAWCRGEVLAYNAATGRHHIGYDDGEDEWIVLESESVVWVQPPGLHPFCAGLDAGAQRPEGAAAEGWRLAVYWPEDQAFYHGRVADYNAITGLHRVHYDDGEQEALNLSQAKLKWLFGPDIPGQAQVTTDVTPQPGYQQQPADALSPQLNADWDDPEDKRWMDGLALEGRGSSTSLPQTPDRALPARLPPHLRKRFTAALGEALKGHVLPGKQLPRDAGSPLGALPLRAAPACLADLLLASMPALSSPSEHHPSHGPREDLLDIHAASPSRRPSTYDSGTALDASECMPQSLLPSSASLVTTPAAMHRSPSSLLPSASDSGGLAAQTDSHSDLDVTPIEDIAPLDMGIELDAMLLAMDGHEHAAVRW